MPRQRAAVAASTSGTAAAAAASSSSSTRAASTPRLRSSAKLASAAAATSASAGTSHTPGPPPAAAAAFARTPALLLDRRLSSSSSSAQRGAAAKSSLRRRYGDGYDDDDDDGDGGGDDDDGEGGGDGGGTAAPVDRPVDRAAVGGGRVNGRKSAATSAVAAAHAVAAAERSHAVDGPNPPQGDDPYRTAYLRRRLDACEVPPNERTLAGRLRLFPTNEVMEEAVFPVMTGMNVVGRFPDRAMVPDAWSVPMDVTGVSSVHALIEVSANGFEHFIEDLGSTNGTRFGQHQYVLHESKMYELSHNKLVYFGTAYCRYERVSPGPSLGEPVVDSSQVSTPGMQKAKVVSDSDGTEADDTFIKPPLPSTLLGKPSTPIAPTQLVSISPAPTVPTQTIENLPDTLPTHLIHQFRSTVLMDHPNPKSYLAEPTLPVADEETDSIFERSRGTSAPHASFCSDVEQTMLTDPLRETAANGTHGRTVSPTLIPEAAPAGRLSRSLSPTIAPNAMVRRDSSPRFGNVSPTLAAAAPRFGNVSPTLMPAFDAEPDDASPESFAADRAGGGAGVPATLAPTLAVAGGAGGGGFEDMLPVSEDDRGMGGKATIAPTLAVASAGAGFELAATMAVPSDADYDSDGVAEGERGGGADFGGTMIVPPQGLMQGAARLEAPPQRGIDALWDGETQCFPDLADRNTGDEENDDEDAAGLVSQIDLQTDLGATRSRRGTPTTPGPDIIVVSSGEKPRPGPSTHFFDGETMETVASSGEDGIAGRSPDLGNATGNASGPREGGTGLGPFAVDPTLAPTMAPFDEFAPAHVQPDATSPIGESPPESLITKPKAGPIRRRRIVADSDTETESDEEELKLKSFGEVAKARGSSLALRNSSTGTLLPRAPATATSSSSIGFVKPTSPPVAPPASPVAPVPVDEPSFVPPMLKPALPTMLDADPLQILSTVAAYAIPEKVPAGGSGPSSRRSSASKSAARSGQSTRENSPTIAPQRAAAISSSTATANPAEHMYAPTLIECDDEEVVAPVAAVDDPRLATAAAPASPSTGAGSKRSSAATSRASSPGPAEGGPGVPAIADRKSRKRKLSKQAVNDAPAPSAAPTPLSTPVSLASPSVAAPVVAAANPAVPSAAVVEPVAPTTASKRKGKGSAKPAPEGATVPKRGRRGKGSASGGVAAEPVVLPSTLLHASSLLSSSRPSSVANLSAHAGGLNVNGEHEESSSSKATAEAQAPTAVPAASDIWDPPSSNERPPAAVHSENNPPAESLTKLPKLTYARRRSQSSASAPPLPVPDVTVTAADNISSSVLGKRKAEDQDHEPEKSENATAALDHSDKTQASRGRKALKMDESAEQLPASTSITQPPTSATNTLVETPVAKAPDETSAAAPNHAAAPTISNGLPPPPLARRATGKKRGKTKSGIETSSSADPLSLPAASSGLPLDHTAVPPPLPSVPAASSSTKRKKSEIAPKNSGATNMDVDDDEVGGEGDGFAGGPPPKKRSRTSSIVEPNGFEPAKPISAGAAAAFAPATPALAKMLDIPGFCSETSSLTALSDLENFSSSDLELSTAVAETETAPATVAAAAAAAAAETRPAAEDPAPPASAAKKKARPSKPSRAASAMAKKSSLDSPAAAPSPLVASGGGGLLATLPPRQKSKGKAPTSPSSAVGALREVDGMDAGADGDDERTAATKGGRRSSWGKSSAPSSQDSTGMDDLNLRRARQRLNSGRTSSPATSQVDHRAFDGAGRADTNADVARHKIMFTGIADTERYEAVVASLGGLCSNNWSDCTHLVTDKIRRTVKFLAALAAGKHIVSVRWLDQSRKVGGFADEAKFLLKDKAAEKSFGFSLDESLRSAKTVRPFAGLEVYATPSVKPPHADLAEMLNAAGAKLVHTIPHAPPSSGRIAVIGCNEDAAECRRHVDAGWTVHSNEFVLTGILRQAVDWREHVLFGGGGGA